MFKFQKKYNKNAYLLSITVLLMSCVYTQANECPGISDIVGADVSKEDERYYVYNNISGNRSGIYAIIDVIDSIYVDKISYKPEPGVYVDKILNEGIFLLKVKIIKSFWHEKKLNYAVNILYQSNLYGIKFEEFYKNKHLFIYGHDFKKYIKKSSLKKKLKNVINKGKINKTDISYYANWCRSGELSPETEREIMWKLE